MNKGLRRTAFRPGDFISGSAVRDALGPQTPRTEAPDSEHHRPAKDAAVAAQASTPRSRVKPLRRWSVAELLAEAVSRPPTGTVAR